MDEGEENPAEGTEPQAPSQEGEVPDQQDVPPPRGDEQEVEQITQDPPRDPTTQQRHQAQVHAVRQEDGARSVGMMSDGGDYRYELDRNGGYFFQRGRQVFPADVYQTISYAPGFERFRDERRDEMVYLPHELQRLRLHPAAPPLRDLTEVRPENVTFTDPVVQAQHKVEFLKDKAEQVPQLEKLQVYRELVEAQEEFDFLLRQRQELRRQPSVSTQQLTATTTSVTTTTVVASAVSRPLPTMGQSAFYKPTAPTPGGLYEQIDRPQPRYAGPPLGATALPRTALPPSAFLPQPPAMPQPAAPPQPAKRPGTGLMGPPILYKEEEEDYMPTPDSDYNPRPPVSVVDAERRFPKTVNTFPEFKGTVDRRRDEDLQHYVNQVRLIRAKVADWSQEVIVQILASKFNARSDLANHWTREGAEIKTIAELVRFLQKHFGDRTSVAERQQNLLRVKMNEEEKEKGLYHSFYVRVENEVALCHQDDTDQQRVARALGLWYKALDPFPVKKEIYLKMNSSGQHAPAELTSTAERMFAFLKEEQLNKELGPMEPRTVNAVTRGQKKNSWGKRGKKGNSGNGNNNGNNKGNGSSNSNNSNGNGNGNVNGNNNDSNGNVHQAGGGRNQDGQNGGQHHYHQKTETKMVTAYMCGPCNCLHETSFACPKTKPPRKCEYCGKFNHKESNCFKKQREETKN